MKKKINKTILLLAALIFVAVASAFTYSKKEGNISDAHYQHEDMRILNYNGHRYVCYRFEGSYKGGASIVHDPDCPCGKH